MRVGRPAAATDIEGLGLWTGPGERDGDVRLYLLHSNVLKHVWETAKPMSFLGPCEMLAHGQMADEEGNEAGAISKGAIQLSHPSRWLQDAYELTEIGALDGYGPLIFDLALLHAGAAGVVPDRSNLSPQAKRFLSAGRKRTKYTLERLPKKVWRYRGNWALDGIWRLTPEAAEKLQPMYDLLVEQHQAGVDLIDWPAVNIPDLTLESFEAWMVGAYRTFFRSRYHGSNRGRGRG